MTLMTFVTWNSPKITNLLILVFYAEVTKRNEWTLIIGKTDRISDKNRLVKRRRDSQVFYIITVFKIRNIPRKCF